jgi:hypothetical protein
MDHGDHWVPVEIKVPAVPMGSGDKMESVVRRESLVLRETRATRDHKDHKDHKEQGG